jgi:hypothetical protein
MVIGRVGQLCAEADTAAENSAARMVMTRVMISPLERTNGAALMPKSVAFDWAARIVP